MPNLEAISIKTGCGKNEYRGHSHPRVWSVEKLRSKPRRSRGGGEGGVRGRPAASTASDGRACPPPPWARAPLTTLNIQDGCLDVTRLPLCCLYNPRRSGCGRRQQPMVVTQVTGGLSLDGHRDCRDCTDSRGNQCRRWRKITDELRGLGEGGQRGVEVWEGGEDGQGAVMETIQVEMASSQGVFGPKGWERHLCWRYRRGR